MFSLTARKLSQMRRKRNTTSTGKNGVSVKPTHLEPIGKEFQVHQARNQTKLFLAAQRKNTASTLSICLEDEQHVGGETLVDEPSTASSSTASATGEQFVNLIRSAVIGDRCVYETPFGEREVVYADYTASGRALSFVEEYMVKVVSTLYANTHTEASFTGAQTTYLREEARDFVRKSLNAPREKYSVVFCGTGSTAAIDKLSRVLGLYIPEFIDKKWNLSKMIPETERPVVFISHFEHHSNELIWRESIARVVVIDEDDNGLPSVIHLEQQLMHYKQQGVPLIGSFSAGSNVTGMKSDTHSIARVLHKHGALAFFDFAGVAAYVDIDMSGNTLDGDCSMDAVFLSPHKFIGGPGASGILVAKRELFTGAFGVPVLTPSIPGGGTVSFVSPDTQTYIKDIEHREDAGTPGIPQSIRAGFVFWIKDQVGSQVIEAKEAHNSLKALESWGNHPRIVLLGSDRPACFNPEMRVPIFSFNILSPVGTASRRFSGHAFSKAAKMEGARQVDPRQVISGSCARLTSNATKSLLPLHHNFVIALLNDVYGIQGRGGCSCAAPYGHLLYNMSGNLSRKFHAQVIQGYEAFKPGWARVNFNYFVSESEVNFILEAVEQIASVGWKLLPFYTQDINSGKYTHLSCLGKETRAFSMSDISVQGIQDGNNASRSTSAKIHFPVPPCRTGERNQQYYDNVLSTATEIYANAEQDVTDERFFCRDFTTNLPDETKPGDIWWLRSSEAAKKLLHGGSNKRMNNIERRRSMRRICSPQVLSQ